MKTFFEKNKIAVIALLVLIIVAVILWLRRRRKGQESGYVMQRGVFDRSTPAPAGGPLTPPGGMPPPPPPGGGTDAPPPPPGGGTPPPPGPTPPPPPPPPYWPPFGYGYPATYYYDPFPRTYIVDEGASERTACYKQVMLNTEAGPKESCLSKSQYVEYLRNRIRGLQVAYDNAMSDMLFGRAWKISQLIKRAEKSLAYELGY